MLRHLCLSCGLLLLAVVLFTACAGDEESDDDQVPNDDDQDQSDDDAGGPTIPAAEPLPAGAVPYLISGPLPVPSHRYEDGSQVALLDGTWRFQEDPTEVGVNEQWFAADFPRDEWRAIEVPGSWNVAYDDLRTYEGVGWYATTFDVPESIADAELDQLMIRIGAVFLRSQIWLNGAKIGEHEGGYTPIHLSAGSLARRAGNVLVLRADNRITWTTVPTDTYFKPGTHGWYPFGGITRPVTLHRLPTTWLFKVEPRFIDGGGDVEIIVGTWADAAAATKRYVWRLVDPLGDEQHGEIELVDVSAGATFYRLRIATNAPLVWSRTQPENIYSFSMTEASGYESLTVRFGYRTIAIDGEQILFNGKRDYWRGINRHSDHQESGPVETPETIALDVARLQELHVNHIRPGHYPVDERLLDALLDAGITVTEEVPVYQWEFNQMSDPDLIANAAHQLGEFVERDKNLPNILVWSVGNEYGNYWPSSRILTRSLRSQAMLFDPSRPAMCMVTNSSCIVPLDFTLDEVDIIGVNQYYGWYLGEVEQAGHCFDVYHALYPNKPIVASEFGADAVAGQHLPAGEEPGNEPSDAHSFTEEFQVWFLENQLDQMLDRPYLSGVMPWLLADFRMEWVGAPHPVPGMNCKGLLTYDRLTEKLSFDFIQEAYEALAEEHPE